MLRSTARLSSIALAALLLGSCGGGGGGGGGNEPPPEVIGVFSGFVGDLNWGGEGLGADGSVGDGGDGDGGIGAGGDAGQFRNARVVAFRQDGSRIGEALTDPVSGMVTVRPGRSYKGTLCLELHGTATAEYYEEGRDRLVPFPAGQVIRVRVPAIDKNIGITPFTEAAFRRLHGTGDTTCTAERPTAAAIRTANDEVRAVLNQQFPRALEVDDIARLPFIKSSNVGPGQIGIGPRGRYGLVNGAFSKQAAMFASASGAPTLDALEQLAEDLTDGVLDGRKGAAAAVPAGRRTYEPNTFTGELSSALAQQATRFGSQPALDALPKLLNFGNTRYQGYLFDGSIDKDGRAYSTVSGWVAGNELDLALGARQNKFGAAEGRIFTFVGNHGHGGGFFKTDETGPPKVFALGDNVNGELGTGNTASTNGRTVQIDLPGELTHVAGGFAHTLARLADGAVYAWGDNGFGQLGANPANVARSLAPRRVDLPRGAVAVAATNLASFALLIDGTVHAWGDSAGFGVLGDGSKTGRRSAPAPVAGLADIVQISARDNDVLALRRDGAVFQWGSFPADVDAFTDGDVSAEYRGGRNVPTRINGLPAGAVVRKVLTEQGLSIALLANGHVYTWGVYFDLTAGQILRDLNATRILGVPPLRDLMPGGFNGYGVRAFDRMTALGIDYRGGMWKLRGRVAEQFDPANPAQQRRPQGQSPRPDCASCHLFLDDWPLTPPRPTNNAVCRPPTAIHGGGGTPSLIHAETECEQCHNPARRSQNPAFIDGGWLNCLKPSNLPRRETPIDPPLITNSCTIPAGHVYTPPGTVCASCHNSIVARPLQSIGAGCAQPLSSELPKIATQAALADARDDRNVVIPPDSITRDATPTLRGTLSATLKTGEGLRVLRNGVEVGSAAVVGTGWSFTDAGNTQQGTVTYAARVTAGPDFGPTSNSLRFTIDSLAPAFAADVTGILDDALTPIADGGNTLDTTPRIEGTIGQALGAGEQVELQRNGATIATFVAAGTSWDYTEPLPLPTQSHTYRARVVDAAGNRGAFGAERSVVIVSASNLPTTTITSINGLADGAATNDTTPRVNLALSNPTSLPAGAIVRVFRNGVSAGTIGTCNTTCFFDDGPLPATAGTTHTYTARAEQAPAFGNTSNQRSIVLDTVPPAAPSISGAVNNKPFQNLAVATDPVERAFSFGEVVGDPNPIVRVSYAALGTGERIEIRRGGVLIETRSPGDASPFATTHPTALNGIGSSPTSTTGIAAGYTAQRFDAAGNPSTATSFDFTINYLACSQSRALAKVNTTGHAHTIASNWTAGSGTANCTGCHSSPTAAGFVAAPPTGFTDRYWCRKS